jgi:ABC-2 type transport system permease protein
MTSRNLFFNLLKEDVKQRLWSVAVAFLLFFFALPVGVALNLEEGFKDELTRKNTLVSVEKWLNFQNGYIVAIIILLSLIMAVTSFSYLHSRQKVDFYHSIPVSRKKMFWANYFNGIFIVIATYVFNLLLSYGVAAVNGILTSEIAGAGIKGFCLFMLHYFLLYTVTVLAMILTGNILVGILGTLVFEFYGCSVFAVLELCYQQFFDTSYQGNKSLLTLMLDKTSPLFLFMANVEGMGSGKSLEEAALRIAVVIVVTVILAFLSFWLYSKRGSEAAGKAMAFKISMPIIRIPIVILASLSGSLFFWLIHSSLGWAVFGLICGLLLSHCAIEIIYHFDFRKLFCNWKQMLACVVLAAAIFLSFRYDLFGYDRYVPAKDSIKYVGISFENTNDWINYGGIEVPQDDMEDYEWRYITSDDYIFSHMQLKDTEPVLTLVNEAISELKEKPRFSQQELPVDDDKSIVGSYRFSVKYTLNNGTNIYRSYQLQGDLLRQEIVQIYENPEFRQAVYPILTQTTDDTAGVKVGRGGQTSVVSMDRNGTDKAITDKLLLTYQEELMNLKVDTMQKENPIASIQFITKKQAEVAKMKADTQNNWQYNHLVERGYYPIYPSFKNTLDLLKEYKVDVDSWNELNEIKEINIDKFQFYKYKETGETMESQYLTISNPDEIKQIIKDAIVEEYSSMNPFMNYRHDQVKFSAVSSSDGSRIEIQYTIPMDKLPEPLKNEIQKIIKEQ